MIKGAFIFCFTWAIQIATFAQEASLVAAPALQDTIQAGFIHPSLSYRIQYLASRDSTDIAFNKYDIEYEIEEKTINGYYRYVSPMVADWPSAMKYLDNAQAKGIQDAWVVYYWQEERISFKALDEIYQSLLTTRDTLTAASPSNIDTNNEMGTTSISSSDQKTSSFEVEEYIEEPDSEGFLTKIFLQTIGGNYSWFYESGKENFLKKLIIRIMIITFVILVIVLFSITLFVRYQNKARKMTIKRFKKRVYGPLTELLFDDDISLEDCRNKDKLIGIIGENNLNKSLFKQVLLDELVTLSQNMKGTVKDKIKAIYQTLGLDEVSRKKIKSFRWSNIADGLDELLKLDIPDHLKEIKKLKNSKNYVVRSLAQQYIIKMDENKSLDFLLNMSYPLSEWQQVNLYRIFKSFKKEDVPIFTPLLHANQESVRIFGLKMIRYFNKLIAVEKILEEMDNYSDAMKREMLKTFLRLNVADGLRPIEKWIHVEDVTLKIAVIQYLGKLGDEHSFEILAREIERETDHMVLFELAKAVRQINQTEADLALANLALHSLKINSIYQHLKDPHLEETA